MGLERLGPLPGDGVPSSPGGQQRSAGAPPVPPVGPPARRPSRGTAGRSADVPAAPSPGSPLAGPRSEDVPAGTPGTAVGVPFGVSAEAFLAERGIVGEPLVVTDGPVRRRGAGRGRAAGRPGSSGPLDLDARATEPVDCASALLAPATEPVGGSGAQLEADDGPPVELPGRFQGPAASRSVGAARGKKGERTWPTREEREARQREKDQARAEDVAADPVGVARQVCLDQLSFAPRTRQELAKALAGRGVPDEAAQEVLSRFTEVGMIDDALFASMWVTSRHRSKGLAGRALSQELRRKGIDDDLVRAAVDELDPEQEADTARALVRRKLAGTRGLATEARVRRLAGMLARKGYGAGTAFRVVKEELEREGTDPPDLPFDALAALEE